VPRCRSRGLTQYMKAKVGDGLNQVADQVIEMFLAGVSTRAYRQVLPEMAETVGVSKSSVSREFLHASEEALKAILDRRFHDVDILVVCIDGLVFGQHHVIGAVGVDVTGHKQVLGIVDGASENALVCKALLEGLAETFTVNRLGLPGKLRRCLCTTNILESPQAGVRMRTERVSRWRDGQMVLRWVASALLATEKGFKRIMGYEQPWRLEAMLKNEDQASAVDARRKVG
jgi:transposase-like protein